MLLDAELDPDTKIDIAPRLFAGIEEEDPRGELERSVADAREDLEGDELDELDAIASQLDDIVTGAVRSSFRLAFIVTAALALAAALLLLAGRPVAVRRAWPAGRSREPRSPPRSSRASTASPSPGPSENA